MHCDFGIGIFGGDEDVGFDKHEDFAREVEVYGVEHVAYACCKHWGVFDEEGAIGTETGAIVFHLAVGKSEGETFVYRLYGEGCICRTASETRTCGYVFVEYETDGREVEILFQQVECTDNQIVVGGAVEDCTCDFESVAAFGCVGIYLLDVDGILKVYGIEDCLEVVVTVRAFRYDIQPYVDFCVWIYNHGIVHFIGTNLR